MILKQKLIMAIKTSYKALHNLAEAEIKLQEVREFISEVIHNSREYDISLKQKKIVEIDGIQTDIKEIMKWLLK